VVITVIAQAAVAAAVILGIYYVVPTSASIGTVGFGDITLVTDAARLVVSAQMLCDLVVIGIIVKLITGVAKRRVQQTGVGSTEQAPTGSG
jgi:hypothetical protein